MSSETDYDGNIHNNLGLIGLWFRKILYDGSSDEMKRAWIGEEFIKQLANKKFSCVFLHTKYLPLPIDEIYEMIKKEKEVIAFLDESVDLDNFTMEDVPCTDCEKSNETIKELQTIQDKQNAVITSNNKLLKGYETYLQIDIPSLIEKAIIQYEKGQFDDTVCQIENIDNMDIHHKDSFKSSNKKIVSTIQNSMDIIMHEKNLKHSLEVNELQDKILKLQESVTNYQEVNGKIQEQLKKYKMYCFKLTKSLNEHKERSLKKINMDLKEGKISVHLTHKKDNLMDGFEAEKGTGNEQIGDC